MNCALLINLLKILVSFATLYYNSLCVNQWGFQLTFEELQTCYSILNLSLDMPGKSCVFWNSTKDTSSNRHATKSCKWKDGYKNFHFAKVLRNWLWNACNQQESSLPSPLQFRVVICFARWFKVSFQVLLINIFAKALLFPQPLNRYVQHGGCDPSTIHQSL